MSLFASVSLIFVLLTLEYAFAFIIFYSDEGRDRNLQVICESLSHNREELVFDYSHIVIHGAHEQHCSTVT